MFLEVFFKGSIAVGGGGGAEEWKSYYISIICFSHTVPVIKKILPSFEPTVLK